MNSKHFSLPLMVASIGLASCGVGDAPSFTLQGRAATGAALASKTVSIRCEAGTATTTTDSTGAYSVELRSHLLPCMLEVDAGAQGKLHGFATAGGRANITPLTELVLARALRANPSTVFASTSPGSMVAADANLAGATAAVVAETTRLMGWTISGDPMKMSFAIGDDDDKALENLAASIASAGTTLPGLVALAAAGTPLLASLPAEETRPHDASAYAINANDAAATTFPAMAAGAGDAVDMSTTQRFAGKLASYDNNPKSPFAAYHVEVPANWNGELVMYTHGYAGEGAVLAANDSSIRRYLIQNGYAWAASGYSKNSFDVRAGLEDTNRLALAFSSITGKPAPSRAYIIGHSMGGQIAAAAVEEENFATAQNKVRYAGAVPMCAVLGDAEIFNGMAAQGLAALVLSGYNAALPAALSSRQRYQMLLSADLNPNSVKLPVHTTLFNNFPNTGFTPKGSTGAAYASVIRNLTGGARPLFDIGLSYGGSYVGGAYANFGTDGVLTGLLNKYNLDTSKITYVVDGDSATSALLNTGAPRVTPDANYNPLRRDGLRWVPLTSGKPYAPVLTLHTLGDLFVPFSMQQIYRNRLVAAGPARADRVVQRAIRGVTHCDFTNAEMQTAFDDMVKWVKQGTKPAGDDVLTAATVAAPTYGCTFTKNVFHPVDEASGSTRTLRGLIQQLGGSCPS